MRATQKNAVEILKRGGAVMVSDWTTGRGRYVSSRPIPAGCRVIQASFVGRMPEGEHKSSCQNIIAKHPRCKSIVYVSDYKAVREWSEKKEGTK